MVPLEAGEHQQAHMLLCAEEVLEFDGAQVALRIVRRGIALAGSDVLVSLLGDGAEAKHALSLGNYAATTVMAAGGAADEITVTLDRRKVTLVKGTHFFE